MVRDAFPGLGLATTSYQEILDRNDVEVVYCAVPHHLHERLYIDAIRAGKHLLGEKPFGIDRAANDAILSAITSIPGSSSGAARSSPTSPGRSASSSGSGRERWTDPGGPRGIPPLQRPGPFQAHQLEAAASLCGEYGCMGDLGIHTQHIPSAWAGSRPRFTPHSARSWPSAPMGRAARRYATHGTMRPSPAASTTGTGTRSPWCWRRSAWPRVPPTPGTSRSTGSRLGPLHHSGPQGFLELPDRRAGAGVEPRGSGLERRGAGHHRTDLRVRFSDALLQMLAAYCGSSTGDRAGVRLRDPRRRAGPHALETAALRSHARGTVEPLTPET